MTPDPAATAPASADPELALSVSNLDVTYRVRDQDRLALRDVSFSIERGESYGLVGESGSGKSTVALALVRYLPSNGRVSAGTISINGLDPLSMGKAALRDLRARTVSMVYQEPGRALNPSLRAGRQIAEVFEIAGRLPGRGDALGRGDAAQGPDIGPEPGHAAVPAPTVRRDGAAGRHRDGAGPLAVAADPGRADDGPRRDGGGRSARPGRGPAEGVRHLGAVHQPQPGGDRQDVQPGRGALRGRAGRGRPRPPGVRRPAAPLHGRAAALHPAARAAQGQRPAGHHPRLPARARSRHDRVRLRPAVRARPGPLPRVPSAVLRRRRPANLALLFPRAGPGPASRHPGLGRRRSRATGTAGRWWSSRDCRRPLRAASRPWPASTCPSTGARRSGWWASRAAARPRWRASCSGS